MKLRDLSFLGTVKLIVLFKLIPILVVIPIATIAFISSGSYPSPGSGDVNVSFLALRFTLDASPLNYVIAIGAMVVNFFVTAFVIRALAKHTALGNIKIGLSPQPAEVFS